MQNNATFCNILACYGAEIESLARKSLVKPTRTSWRKKTVHELEAQTDSVNTGANLGGATEKHMDNDNDKRWRGAVQTKKTGCVQKM